MADQRRGPWSQHEDRYLMSLVDTQGALNWVKISQMLGSRTPKQCRERYHQNLKPSLNHEPITADEGALIEQLVVQIGKRWAEIARRLHNRSDNAVKNWWNGSMNRRKRLYRRRVPGHDDAAIEASYARTPARLQLPSISTSYPQYLPLSPPGGSSNLYPHNAWNSHSGIPSPSAISPATDSLMDGAPSLMSDSGSYGSASPTTTGPPDSPNVELPPLRLGDSTGSFQGYPTDSAYKPASSNPQPLSHQIYLPPIRDALDCRMQLMTAPNSPTAGVSRRLSQTLSQSMTTRESPHEKDSRMTVNHLLD
ncbi:myb-like DNA-binding domain-containing protein [Xylariales sp. AK1849]|nr:myb-like DNA-binding domain-containing protein [Xylariales sp. AK1849]